MILSSNLLCSPLVCLPAHQQVGHTNITSVEHMFSSSFTSDMIFHGRSFLESLTAQSSRMWHSLFRPRGLSQQISRTTPKSETPSVDRSTWQSFIRGLQSSQSYDQKGFVISVARPEDADEITQLIRNAFSVWPQDTYILYQTNQQVDSIKTCLEEEIGFVVRLNGKIVASVILNDSEITDCSDEGLVFLEKGHEPFVYSKVSTPNRSGVRGLFIKKMVVDPIMQNQGIGTQILDYIYEYCKICGYQFTTLETALETDWLHEWYQRQGYLDLATQRYEEFGLTLVLMQQKLG